MMQTHWQSEPRCQTKSRKKGKAPQAGEQILPLESQAENTGSSLIWEICSEILISKSPEVDSFRGGTR